MPVYEIYLLENNKNHILRHHLTSLSYWVKMTIELNWFLDMISES